MTKEVYIALIQKDIRELDMIAHGLYETELPSPTIIKLATLKAHDVITNLQLLADVKGISEPEIQQTETGTKHSTSKKGNKKPKETPVVEKTEPVDEAQVIVDKKMGKQALKKEGAITETEFASVTANPISNFKEPQIPKQETSSQPTTILKTPEPIIVKEELQAPITQPEPKITVETSKKEAPLLKNQPSETKLQKGKSLFNTLSNKKGGSLRKSISIGDRFMFQRELFANNADKMNDTIDFIDNCSSVQEAESYLSKNFNWDADKESVIEFFNLVNRKFD